ncbi:nucleotidyltransferase domain-containing protein [Patescibacteria group bacterium]|nr:nucleotidyltransferase domain-containing protein [Patescibacteria group bacterium]MBU1931147.1 nucleotidyltransferase domain-containing protein [Patescibacteria group bacterium]
MLDKARLKKLADYFKNQPVDLVYLFGSQATGKNTKLSDIDIAVLFKDSISKSRRFDLRCRFISDLMGVLKTEKVEVVDLSQAHLSFAYSIIFPNKTVLVKNESKMVNLEKRIIKQYLDIQPYLHRIHFRQLELMAQEGFKNE